MRLQVPKYYEIWIVFYDIVLQQRAYSKKTQTMPGVARGKPEGPTGPTATAYNYAEVLADGARAPRWKKNQGYKMQMAW